MRRSIYVGRVATSEEGLEFEAARVMSVNLRQHSWHEFRIPILIEHAFAQPHRPVRHVAKARLHDHVRSEHSLAPLILHNGARPHRVEELTQFLRGFSILRSSILGFQR